MGFPRLRTNLGTTATLLAVLLLAAQAAGSRQGGVAKQLFDLYRADVIHFSAPPPSMVVSGTKCSRDGDIYAIYSGSPQSVLGQPNGVSRLPIRKTSVGTKEVKDYRLPVVPGYRNLIRYGFDVDPSGTVYVLASASQDSTAGAKPKPVWLIIKYKDDGSMDSYLKAGAQSDSHLQPLRIAAFADGDFLLSGTRAAKGSLATFAGVFDRQATFMTPVTLAEVVLHAGKPTAKEDKSPSTAKAGAPVEAAGSTGQSGGRKQPVHENRPTNASVVGIESSTLTVSAPDGDIYVLQGTSSATVSQVSATGQILRRIHMEAPSKGYEPTQFAMTGPGDLFICYNPPGGASSSPNSPPPGYIVVFSTTNGKVAATYRVPHDAANKIPACAVSPDDFLFLGTSKNRQLEVVRYVAR